MFRNTYYETIKYIFEKNNSFKHYIIVFNITFIILLIILLYIRIYQMIFIQYLIINYN